MNDVLSLSGKFQQKKNDNRPGQPQLPRNGFVNSAKLLSLLNDMLQMKKFWSNENVLNICLISAYYCKIAAKSNRIQGFFSNRSSDPNHLIVGAKFTKENLPKHIITYRVPMDLVEHTIVTMRQVIDVLENEFNGYVDADQFNDGQTFKSIKFDNYGIVKTAFQKCIVDAWYVTKFDVEGGDVDTSQTSIITLFDTGEDTVSLLRKIGVNAYNHDLLDAHTIRLDESSLNLLMTKAPYLVAMSTEDINELSPEIFSKDMDGVGRSILPPSDEPIVGVIDTLFDNDVYFNEWVNYESKIDPNISTEASDYWHGTEVTSIIVDGPDLNPRLDDGCGHFRVRHFGVALNRPFSSFFIIQKIKEIISANPDIHVWNLSLGANTEVNNDFVSAEGSVLDQIQYDNNVIFVIAATNKSQNSGNRIGAPADSVNSMVVSSVDLNNKPADYSREGTVLSFFTKPDVSYYGGVEESPIRVFDSRGDVAVAGTSFAAPWITRKLAYLIEILGLSREVAKALIVDSAIGWNPEANDKMLSLRGNGVVPVRIEDILHTSNDEIKFILEGTSENFNTYNYDLPVPIVDQKQPFIAKATLCYYPKCSRNQGVDYTNTELDLYFGRIKNDGKINSIDKNVQSSDDGTYVSEQKARKKYRKWDNAKHISEVLKDNLRPKKIYDNPLWAISVKTKERLQGHDGDHIRFGIVITLHEIKGVNRIEDFIQQASLKGWIVDRIDVKNRIEIYSQGGEDIHFE